MSRRQTKSLSLWVRRALGLLALGLLLYHGTILIRIIRFRHVNPPTTALMRERAREAHAQGRAPRRLQIWTPYDRFSPHLVRAVLAGEDPRFFVHHGFDWIQIRQALRENLEEGEIVRGASTITQQLAKNLFLSTARTPWRKLHEAVITLELEALLGKRRILELYLNVIEWGDGIYGAEAAARHYFGVSAAALTPEQAAFLAALIPNPRDTYNPAKNPHRVERRRRIIQRRMRWVALPDAFRPSGAKRSALTRRPRTSSTLTLGPQPSTLKLSHAPRGVCESSLSAKSSRMPLQERHVLPSSA